jgi:hypothetical protein
MQEALSIYRCRLGDDSAFVASVLETISQFHADIGDEQAALAYANEAGTIRLRRQSGSGQSSPSE